MSILFKPRKYVSNFPGWRTKRKLLVIESDDWGSVRMSGRENRIKLLNKKIIDESNRYSRYDTLATGEDLSALFEVLNSYKDKDKKPAVMTPVTIVANPDFEKIRNTGFETYYYEAFTDTLNRYYGKESGIFDRWKEGIAAGLFKPQFHGREHLNVPEWMRALKQNDKATRTAFDYGIWGFDFGRSENIRINSYQAAFDLFDPADLEFHAQSIVEGLELFESLFGYKADFFVPPNGPFNNSLEKTAADHGIKYISKSKIQAEPLGYGKTKKSWNRLGQRNKSGQVYLTRNCIFEPSEEGKDWVDSCLNDIRIAFRMKKPAVISTHRVNYIGELDERNRSRGLKQLDELLSKVTKHWQEVEFITSAELGDIIAGKKDGR